MMLLKEKHLPRYTVRDYERWKGYWELVEGIPYALVSSSLLSLNLRENAK